MTSPTVVPVPHQGPSPHAPIMPAYRLTGRTEMRYTPGQTSVWDAPTLVVCAYAPR